MDHYSVTGEEVSEDGTASEPQNYVNSPVSAISFQQKQKDSIDITLSILNSLDFSEDQPHSVVAKYLKEIMSYCEQGITHRRYVAEKQFMNICVKLGDVLFYDTVSLKCETFAALTAMVTDNQDSMDAAGIQFTVENLRTAEDPVLLMNILNLITASSKGHQNNLKEFLDVDVLPAMERLLVEKSHEKITMKSVFLAHRALMMVDDIHNVYGRNPGMVRIILSIFVGLLGNYLGSKYIVEEILLILGEVLDSKVMCDELSLAGRRDGPNGVLRVIQNYPHCKRLNEMSLKIIKVLATSDLAKDKIMREDGASIIVNSMRMHESSPEVTALGNDCIAALCLGNPDYTEYFKNADAHIAILQGMRTHHSVPIVQKTGCRAIGNMVIGSQAMCALFLDNNAETLLNDLLVNLTECKYSAMAALDILGCAVNEQFAEQVEE